MLDIDFFILDLKGIKKLDILFFISVCNVGSGCIVRQPCGACTPRSTIKCENTCSMYGRCFGGKFHVQRCREGGMFSRQFGRCIPGRCPEEEKSPFAAGAGGRRASDGD